MGKRELGLILGFFAVGVLVWQVTAPKAESSGFSIGRFIDDARREIRGRSASAEVTTAPAIPVAPSTSELRLTLSGEITVTGEDRDDIVAELVVRSNGFDEAEARSLASEVELKVSTFADAVAVGWSYPSPGRQEARLRLRVPARLTLQLDGNGRAKIANVQAVALSRASGTLTLANVHGVIQGEFRGGDLTIDGARALDLVTAGSDATIRSVREDVRLEARSGNVRVDRTASAASLRGRDGRIRIDEVLGSLTAETVDGSLELGGVRGEIDIKARDTEVRVVWARAATAKIQATEGGLDLELPTESTAFAVDAHAVKGELRVPDTLQRSTSGDETSATKKGGAGAPEIFVRGSGTTITIR